MHFAYTAPLPTPPVGALSAMPALHVAFVALCFALVGIVTLRQPKPVPAMPTADASRHPFYCERTRRWRDPVTLRFVKSPR